MPALIRGVIAAVTLLSALGCFAQTTSADLQTKLLDHLAGHWVMTGTIDGKQTTHDVNADWVLNGEYLRLHEVSREKDSQGAPAYEAIVFLSWNPKRGEYDCLWLDNTAGGALSAEGIAHGEPTADAIPLVFVIKGKEALHTTFRYDAHTNSWQLTIDDITSGKSERFADVQLTRDKVR